MKLQDVLWYNLSSDECLKRLDTTEVGLKLDQIGVRQKKFGANELPVAKRLPSFRVFLRQFTNILMLILIGSAVISFIMHHYLDAMVISAAVFLNIIVGFLQENKAEKALEKLRQIVLLKARVIRSGQLYEVNATELVPGDILMLASGEQVPADARVFELKNLETSEAILTGESISVIKSVAKLSEDVTKQVVVSEQKNMVFKGTLVVEGKAQAVVTATGVWTEIGRIASLLKTTEDEKTPLQQKLTKFSQKLGIFVLLIAFAIVVLGVLQGKEFWEIFMVAVAVAVSAIPEGLLIAITVVLVIGMQRILKKEALVKKMVAAETLGSTSVVCVDKTGTLTEGIMRAEKIFTVHDEFTFDIKTKYLELPLPPKFKKLIEYTYLCNNAIANHHGADRESWQFVGTPTEKALLEAVFRFELNLSELKHKYPRVEEKPFDSFTKMMTTIHDHGAGRIAISKGAPERILAECEYYCAHGENHKLLASTKAEITSRFAKYSLQGRRLIATAYKSGSGWVFLGGFVIQDPVRESVPEAVRLAHKAGLRVIMITGDHGLTARAIAKEVGLKVGRDGVLLGEELDALSDTELAAKLKEIVVFARVTPTHKIRIVQAWQSLGQVVAMTGDGINDAPALKAADIGLAVGSATDVTRETADLILLKSDFSVIIEAIKEGRIIFQNIRKVIVYLLIDSLNALTLVVASLVMGFPLPLTAVQILWVNLIADGLPATALTVEKSEEHVMAEPPRPKNTNLIDRQMVKLILTIAIVTSLLLLLLFVWLLKFFPENIEFVRTIIFVAFGVDSLLYVFSCKSLIRPIFKTNILDNIYLIYAVIFGFVLLLVPLYVPFMQRALFLVPLGWQEWIFIFVLAFLKLGLIELAKYVFTRKNHKKLFVWKN